MKRTPRQIVDAVICTVLDEERNTRDNDCGTRRLRIGDAVLETLKDYGVDLYAHVDDAGLVTM